MNKSMSKSSIIIELLIDRIKDNSITMVKKEEIVKGFGTDVTINIYESIECDKMKYIINDNKGNLQITYNGIETVCIELNKYQYIELLKVIMAQLGNNKSKYSQLNKVLNKLEGMNIK